MLNPIIDLDIPKMLISLGMVAIAIGMSVWYRLAIAQNLLIATIRSIIQLIVVGFLLDTVFAINQPLIILFMIFLMSLMAAREAKNRVREQVPLLLPMIWLSVIIGTLSILGYVTILVVQPDRWYAPQYLIPLAGMILGNSMNGAAIAAERFTQDIVRRSREIETYLCLGATPIQAIANYQSEAIRAAMIPTINVMMVAGVVSLPGMMTGQILGGVSPLLAVRYQLVILFAVTTANLITALILTNLVIKQFFTPAQQLKLPS
ncbi:MAG: iron export ABC transporter permease subunit FetB [Pseudanabaenaceae cyanobacterium bins.39]|nr:iron export ABC transporter permease subunit FetB [Pseudanabaenaceae cyanobacterium bins.39]